MNDDTAKRIVEDSKAEPEDLRTIKVEDSKAEPLKLKIPKMSWRTQEPMYHNF